MNKLIINKIHFPTALGLLILVIAIFLGIFFAKTKTETTGNTTAAALPQQVRITNVTDTGWTVSWITDKIIDGLIKIGETNTDLKQTALDDRDQLSGEKGQFEVHYVTAKNLKPNTKYFFKIESGGKQFDNNSKPFEVTTGSALANPPAADPVYGTVLTQSGTAAEGAIVYINLANAAPLSALTKNNGNWALSLATARTPDLNSFVKYDAQATIINILVQAGKIGTASAIATTINDSPVPDIILGKSQDFRAIAKNNNPTEDTATASAGEKPKSGFLLDPLIAEVGSGSGSPTQTGEVVLENPRFEGEVINATQPAFIGSGPPGMVLAIEVHSPTGYTGSATINDKGEWEFTAPKGLTPGEHTVTISYIGSDGKEGTLTRNFVIAAAGATTVPAITATPSGALDSTNSGRTSLPSTASGLLHPGSGEVTLLMLLTGIGLLVGGLKIKNVV